MKPYITNDVGGMSQDGQAVVATSFELDYLVRGKGHEVHRRFSIKPGITKFVLDFTECTRDYIFSMPIYGGTSKDQVYMDSYRISSYSGGTEVPSVNPQGAHPIAAEGKFVKGVVSTDVAGDDLRQYIYGTQSQGNVAGGGGITGNHPKISGTDTIIMLEITASTNLDLELNLLWYEV